MCEISISVKGLLDWIEWTKNLVICQRPVFLGKHRTELTVSEEAAQRGRQLQKAAACKFFFNIHSWLLTLHLLRYSLRLLLLRVLVPNGHGESQAEARALESVSKPTWATMWPLARPLNYRTGSGP